uniref:Uncharacterized protein n=1 Tax=Salmonella phage vB_SEnST11_KE22 TaxID=3161173 RepID=A0AAU8GFD2_9CAUD
MTSKTHVVVRDFCHEATGNPSTVGQTVVEVVFLPALSPVSIFDKDRLAVQTMVNKDVYLCTGGSSRICMNGEIVDRTFVARVGKTVYEGNDLYSAEELGIMV